MKALMIKNVLRCGCVIPDRPVQLPECSLCRTPAQAPIIALEGATTSLNALLSETFAHFLYVFALSGRCSPALLPAAANHCPCCRPSRSRRRRCVSYNNKLLGLSPNKSYNVLELGLFALQFTTTVVVCRLHLYI